MKIRCSALGRLMTAPRNKTEVLSKTAQSYIQELVLEEKFGIKKELVHVIHGQGFTMRRRSNKFSKRCFGFRVYF
jgi:hypothetical protein